MCLIFYQLLPTTSVRNEQGQQLRIQIFILGFKGTVLRRFFSSFAYVCFLNLLALNLTDVCKKLACSQTLYFLFKVRRERVIKNKPRGIYWPTAQGGSGGGRRKFFFLALRARSVRSRALTRRCFRKERKEKELTTSVYRLVKNYHSYQGNLQNHIFHGAT